jgi:hypothetical protein
MTCAHTNKKPHNLGGLEHCPDCGATFLAWPTPLVSGRPGGNLRAKPGVSFGVRWIALGSAVLFALLVWAICNGATP